MSLESEDQSSPDKAPGTLPEFQKQSKISYTREFLLSLSELDVCKELPGGFDRSILSEFEDISHGIEDRQRIPGSSLLQGFRPRDYDSSPPTRVDTGNYSRGIHGRWDNRSSGRSDKDSDSQSDLDSDSGRRYGSQSRWPRQTAEHDGLLGSGSFPRPSGFSAGVSVPKALTDDQHQLNRTNEPYHPPRPYKAVPHLRRETRDSLNDETFGSTESTSQDRAEEERRRRASFELMRKEQHKVLQEKQKLNQSKHRDDFLSEVTVSLEQTKEEKRPLERDNELDGSGTLPVPINDTGNSLPSQIPAYRPLVPPGFTSTILEKNSAPKSIIPNHEKEVGKIEMEESLLHAKASPIQNWIFNNQEERRSVHGMGLIEQHPDDKSIHAAFLNKSANIVNLTSGLEDSKKQLGLDDALDNDEIIELTAKEVTGDKIVNDSNQDNPTSILEKLFGSALTVNTGGPSGFMEHHDIKHDDTLSPNKVKSSKFAHWFREDAEKRLTDNLSFGGPSDLLSLIVGGEKAESQTSDVKATRQIPLEFSYRTSELTKELTFTVPSATTEGTVSAVLTCEDLEQTILSEYSEKSSALQLPVQDVSVSGEPKTKIDNHASQHLLSLLQKGVGPQDLTPSSNFNIGPSNKLHVPEVSAIPREAKTEDNSDSGKNITLETLFGSAFMKELQSFEAPVSLHRVSLGPTRSDILEPHDGPFPSAIDEVGLNRINRESNILPSNQKQENKLDKFENWLGFENRHIEVGPSKVGPIHGSFDGGVEIQLPEEENLIAVGDPVNPRNSGFMPAGNSNRGEFLTPNTPNDIAEKLAALSVGFNHERGPYDMMVSERQFYPPQMNQGRALFPLDSHPRPAHINSQRASFQHEAPPNNQFPASMLRHPFHHHNTGPTRFDLPAHHQMLQQQMQMPGNYPPRHALHEFPRGAHPHPHPHPSNQTSGFMQEPNQMQGFPFGHRQQNVGGLAMPLPGPDVSSGGSHPEALQRLLGMEQRANSKQTRPYGANYGHELDMGFRYR